MLIEHFPSKSPDFLVGLLEGRDVQRQDSSAKKLDSYRQSSRNYCCRSWRSSFWPLVLYPMIHCSGIYFRADLLHNIRLRISFKMKLNKIHFLFSCTSATYWSTTEETQKLRLFSQNLKVYTTEISHLTFITSHAMTHKYIDQPIKTIIFLALRYYL